VGQGPPSATLANQVENCVQDITLLIAGRSAQLASGWKQLAYDVPLHVFEITRIRFVLCHPKFSISGGVFCTVKSFRAWQFLAIPTFWTGSQAGIGIKGYREVRRQSNEQEEIWLELEEEGGQCRYCGNPRIVSKGRYERQARHLDVFGRASRLRILTRRWECRRHLRLGNGEDAPAGERDGGTHLHIARLLRLVDELRQCAFEPLTRLAKTLQSWIEPLVTMWRLTKNNGITEGFHRKMKLIQRRAYGFRNFHNYRLRVIAQCG
jgi:hypothetical protein